MSAIVFARGDRVYWREHAWIVEAVRGDAVWLRREDNPSVVAEAEAVSCALAARAAVVQHEHEAAVEAEERAPLFGDERRPEGAE